MRVNFAAKATFGAALSSAAASELDKATKEAKVALYSNQDYTIFDIPSSSFYLDKEHDTGRGKLNSNEALKILKTMKPYLGFNAIKDYPMGRIDKHQQHYNCPYNRSSLTLGEDNINLEKLCSSEYGNLLEFDDISEAVERNFKTNNNPNYVNYENETGTSLDYPILKPLRKAYDNFQTMHSSPNDQLRIEFEFYKKAAPFVKNYDRIALYPIVAKSEPDLFENFKDSPEKQKRFSELKTQYAKEIEFFKFRQFLAFKQMIEAKNNINELGVEVMGDIAIGSSPEEYWAFPDAFDKNESIGYGFYKLKYQEYQDKDSDVYYFLKSKMQLGLMIYDALRLDVGVSYEKYKTIVCENGIWSQEKKSGYDNKDTVIKIIEETAKEIKGDDYDLRKISYEADGAGDILFDWSDNNVKQKGNLIGRNLILTTTYEQDSSEGNLGWGSYDFYTKTAKISEDDLTLGVNNHDGTPAQRIARNKDKYQGFFYNPIPALSKTFKIPEEELQNPQKWLEIKMSEPFLANRKFVYFTDVFGKDIFYNDIEGAQPKDHFRYRLDENFEKEYHKELQAGNAFNYPQTLARIMKTKGIDEKFPSLYSKLSYLGEYLRKQGALTQKDADKETQIKGYDEVLDTLSKM